MRRSSQARQTDQPASMPQSEKFSPHLQKNEHRQYHVLTCCFWLANFVSLKNEVFTLVAAYT